MGSCALPVFSTVLNITAVLSLKQDKRRPIRQKEKNLILCSGGVEGTQDCPLRPCGDHTGLPAVALVYSKDSSTGAGATSCSPLLSCGSALPVAMGQQSMMPSLEFRNQVCLVDSSCCISWVLVQGKVIKLNFHQSRGMHYYKGRVASPSAEERLFDSQVNKVYKERNSRTQQSYNLMSVCLLNRINPRHQDPLANTWQYALVKARDLPLCQPLSSGSW